MLWASLSLLVSRSPSPTAFRPFISPHRDSYKEDKSQAASNRVWKETCQADLSQHTQARVSLTQCCAVGKSGKYPFNRSLNPAHIFPYAGGRASLHRGKEYSLLPAKSQWEWHFQDVPCIPAGDGTGPLSGASCTSPQAPPCQKWHRSYCLQLWRGLTKLAFQFQSLITLKRAGWLLLSSVDPGSALNILNKISVSWSNFNRLVLP